MYQLFQNTFKMMMTYKLEVVDHRYNVKKVVTPEHRIEIRHKIKVVGNFWFVISLCCFSIDVFIMYVLYPDAWVYGGCCGILGMFFLMLAIIFWNVDRAASCIYKMKVDLEKCLRSGKLIVWVFGLLFLVLIVLVLKYFLV